MEKNIQNLLKRDLKLIPLTAYFVFYFLYLLFERVLELKDYAVLVKPVIIPIIAFLYLNDGKSKKTFLNLFLLILIFVSDNSVLLEIRSFHVYAMIIYTVAVYILIYYAFFDIKNLDLKNSFIVKYLKYFLIIIFVLTLLFWIVRYDLKLKTSEPFIVAFYLFSFSFLFFLSLWNMVFNKIKRTKYLFFMTLCLFLGDFLFSIHYYYNGHFIFKYLICFVEVPVYYFLLKYLLKRDKELIEQ